MDAIQFSGLLSRMEGKTLDFKATAYRISNDPNKIQAALFVKDVICMANTPRKEDSFIILGVKKHKDGTYDLLGLDYDEDEEKLQTQLESHVHPIPTISYEIVEFQEKRFGVVIIPPKRIGPCVPTTDYGNILRKRQVYIRHGSKNDTATPEDHFEITDWIRGKDHSPSPVVGPNDMWGRFLQSVKDFDRSRKYILLAPPVRDATPNDLAAFGLAPWTAVFDFDPDSDTGGLLGAIRGNLESKRSLHLVVHGDRPVWNPDVSTYWFFARGLTGRDATLAVGPWKQWASRYQAELAEQLRRIASACAPSPVTIVALWYDSAMLRFLQSTLDAALGAFGEAAEFVVVTKHPTDVETVAGEYGAEVLDMPLHHLAAGLEVTHHAMYSTHEGEVVALPSSSGAPMIVAPEVRRWLEEELEFVHLNSGSTMPDDYEINSFLRGSELGWFEAGCHDDVERDKTSRLQQQVYADLGRKRTVRINLYHAPGAGGTTVARRILWNLHKEFPCAVLLGTNPPKTAERLYRISALTGLPILVLVDGATIAEREVDELYDYLRSRQIPVVLLQTLRRFKSQNEGERAYYLKSELSKTESMRFLTIYSKARPEKSNRLQDLVHTPDLHKRIPFYFGLVTFEQDFKGLESYIRSRIEDLTEAQTKILCSLAIAHHYAQRALPVQVFSDILGTPKNKAVDIRQVFRESTLELLVEEKNGRWRTAHELFAVEVLQQLLAPAQMDRKTWKQRLSITALYFADLCRGTGTGISDELLEVARRAFIYRDNTDLLGTERSAQATFSQLIEDIPSVEGRLGILKHLVELFPEEAHFWAHLGRYYAMAMENYPDALEAIDCAIELQRRSGNEDHVLYHMRGMAIRYEVYKRIGQRVGLDEVLEYAKAASEAFEAARALNSNTEHPFISEVQMLARVMEYAGSTSGGVFKYLALPTAEPYLREALGKAEDLLEQVRRNREGEGASAYEEDCRGILHRLYGHHDQALQTWDNLLSRKGVYHPPLRRQIVWTLLDRNKRTWDSLKTSEIDRIIRLLDQNLTEEGNNDKDLRLWVQAVRRAKFPPPLETVIERVGYWKANSGSLDSVYYLYVFYSLLAMEGFVAAHDSALRNLEVCRSMSRFRRNRTKSLEWLGQGSGITRLVHHSELGEWTKEGDFWRKTEKLAKVRGRIARIDSPQSGHIELAGGMVAFFVPTHGGHTQENQLVEFYLGFSYDGLRAWRVHKV